MAQTRAHPQIRPRARRQPLLDLAELEQLVALDEAAELADDRDVLAHVPAELAELGVLLHEALHVRDGLNRGRVVRERVRLVRLHVRLERCAEVAERREVVRLEEWVRRCRECYFLYAVGLSVGSKGDNVEREGSRP